MHCGRHNSPTASSVVSSVSCCPASWQVSVDTVHPLVFLFVLPQVVPYPVFIFRRVLGIVSACVHTTSASLSCISACLQSPTDIIVSHVAALLLFPTTPMLTKVIAVVNSSDASRPCGYGCQEVACSSMAQDAGATIAWPTRVLTHEGRPCNSRIITVRFFTL